MYKNTSSTCFPIYSTCLDLFGETEVDHMLDIRYGQAGLRDVGGQNDLPETRRTLLEDPTVLLPGNGRVDRKDPQRIAGIRLPQKQSHYQHLHICAVQATI